MVTSQTRCSSGTINILVSAGCKGLDVAEGGFNFRDKFDGWDWGAAVANGTSDTGTITTKLTGRTFISIFCILGIAVVKITSPWAGWGVKLGGTETARKDGWGTSELL